MMIMMMMVMMTAVMLMMIMLMLMILMILIILVTLTLMLAMRNRVAYAPDLEMDTTDRLKLPNMPERHFRAPSNKHEQNISVSVSTKMLTR